MTDAEARIRLAGRDDVSSLQEFTCADPARASYRPGTGSYHPAPWELDVQSYVRSLRPSRRSATSNLLVLHRQSALVGVIEVALADDDDEEFVIPVVAVARGHQRRGLGRRLVAEALDALASLDGTGARRRVFARIDVRNVASERLFSSFGFVVTDAPQVESTLRLWARASATR